MLEYLDQRNKDPKPFVWTADADLISAKPSDFLNVFLAQDTDPVRQRRDWWNLPIPTSPTPSLSSLIEPTCPHDGDLGIRR